MSCANEVVISGAGRLWPNRSVNSIPAVAWARVRSVSSKSVGLNMGFEQSVDHGRVGAQEPGGDHEHRGGEPAARSQCRLVDQYVTAVGGHLGVDRRQFPPARDLAGAELLDRGRSAGRLLDRLMLATGDDDVCPGPREGLSNRPPEAAATPL